MEERMRYYSQPGLLTRLDGYAEALEHLPADPVTLYQVAQGLIVHDLWVQQYGVAYDPAHEYPQKTSTAKDLLDKALQLDPSDIAIPRHPRDRVIACCREFAMLMTALLRAKGIPARSRCGFAAYFGWGEKVEDHWICEYWNGSRWVMADPQLDPLQQSFLIRWTADRVRRDPELAARVQRFNPRDLTQDEFLTAGRAWLLCRKEGADPMRFGIGCTIRPEWGIDTLYGLWFVRGQLLRDFAALNKVEPVPYLVRICKRLDWKSWRLVGSADGDLSPEDWALLDEIAALTVDADANFERIRTLYEGNADLKVPDEIIAR